MKSGISEFRTPFDPEDLFDWDQLRVFRMVAHLGSMSAAANQLNASLPTISRRVSDLESTLATSLITRSPKGIDLTDAGERLTRHADVMADIVHALHLEVGEIQDLVDGPVRIASCEAVGPYWLAPQLARLSLDHPGLRPSIIVSDLPFHSHSRHIDLMIQVKRPSVAELIIRRLGRLQYRYFWSPHPTMPEPPQSMSDLRFFDCLVPEDYAALQMQATSTAPNFRSLLTDAMTSNSLATLAAICQSGGGIAILPAFMMETMPGLVPLDTLYPPSLDLWLAYPPRLRDQQRGHIVINWIKEVFEPSAHKWFQETPAGRRPTPERPPRKTPRRR